MKLNRTIWIMSNC